MMKLKLTPTQNLCVGFLESGFKVMQINDEFFFVKGERRQKVLEKSLMALVNRGAVEYREEAVEDLLSDAFVEHRQQMRSLVSSRHTRH
jgi:hypothetical protein